MLTFFYCCQMASFNILICDYTICHFLNINIINQTIRESKRLDFLNYKITYKITKNQTLQRCHLISVEIVLPLYNLLCLPEKKPRKKNMFLDHENVYLKIDSVKKKKKRNVMDSLRRYTLCALCIF